MLVTANGLFGEIDVKSVARRLPIAQQSGDRSPRFNGAAALALMVAIALFGPVLAAEAAPPWSTLISFSRVDADPAKTYTLGENNGPWMIMASTFSGEGAQKQAQDLVYELRKRYKFEAYSHKVKFALGDTGARRIDRYGNPVKGHYRQGSEIEEYAVLVGNYKAVDDPDAQATLQKVKLAQPQCLDFSETKPTAQSLAGWRVFLQEKIIGDKKKGPMNYAFISTNPLLPKEYFSSSGVDELVVSMNKDVPHSLLDCQGKFSVLVATFKGKSSIKQDEIKDFESGKDFQSDLAMAAQKAHVLTESLRIKGYEAYEFHDRYSSIVTVGSFESVGTPREDGKIEINPKVHAVMETFRAQPVSVAGGAMQPQKMGPFPTEGLGELFFDIQPMPVEIPRRSLAAVHNQKAHLLQ
jgi:hypothetical protein